MYKKEKIYKKVIVLHTKTSKKTQRKNLYKKYVKKITIKKS